MTKLNSNKKNNELALKAQAGDEKAMTEVMEQVIFISKLYYKNNFSNYERTIPSDDIAQDTAFRVVRQLKNNKYKKGSSFNSYISTITKNLFIDEIRAYKRKFQTVSIEELTDPSPINTEKELSLKECKEVREELLKKMSSKMTTTYIKFIEGYKCKELAEEFNIPLSTVLSHIRYTRTKLKPHLKEFYYTA